MWVGFLRFVTESTVGRWNPCLSVFPIAPSACCQLFQYRVSPCSWRSSELAAAPPHIPHAVLTVNTGLENIFTALTYFLGQGVLSCHGACGGGSKDNLWEKVHSYLQISGVHTQTINTSTLSFSCTWISDPCVIFLCSSNLKPPSLPLFFCLSLCLCPSFCICVCVSMVQKGLYKTPKPSESLFYAKI